MKKLIFRAIVIAILLGAGWWGYSYVRRMPQRRQDIPLAKVRQGEIVISAFSRGELRALRSEPIVAPNLMGTVQVTRLAAMGAFAREKNLIVEFDDSEVLSRIEEDQLNLQSLDENLKRQQAELSIRNNQDEVDLLQAKYAVRRSELQVKRNELLSAIDARKNVLSLEQAKRTLTQTESDVKSRREQAQAQIDLLRQQRQRQVVELQREQSRLSQTKVLATMSGLVGVRQNTFGGARQFGSQIPDIREGDQVQPGMPVADILDLSELEVVAKIGELDRANLVEGQEATIQLDALAGKTIHGKIKSMSGTASANVFSGDPSKKFEVLFSVDMKELLSTVGASPEQIREVLATAEKNRSRPVNRTPLSGMAMNGGPRGAGGGRGGVDPSMTGGRGQGGAMGGPPGIGFDPEAMGAGGQGGARRRGGQGADAGSQGQGGRQRGGTGSEGGAARGGGGRGQGGEPGARGGQGGQRGGGGAFAGRFTQQELDSAELPPPPGEESGLQILLRPGLLADLEVVIEKIPNAIYIPAQAVFESGGRPVVYVRTAERFEERPVQLLKRSESTMVISSGLRPGESVALVNPTVDTSKKKKSEPKADSVSGNPMGGAPGGKQ